LAAWSLFGGGRGPPLQGRFQVHDLSSWSYLSMVLKKAHPYGTDDFLAEKRGFYPAYSVVNAVLRRGWYKIYTCTKMKIVWEEGRFGC
jgi:hypothetical protein